MKVRVWKDRDGHWAAKLEPRWAGMRAVLIPRTADRAELSAGLRSEIHALRAKEEERRSGQAGGSL